MLATAGGPSRRPRRIIRVPTTTTKQSRGTTEGTAGGGVLGAVWTMNPAAGLVDGAAEFRPRRAGKKKTEAG